MNNDASTREGNRSRSRISFAAIANLAEMADYTIPFAIRAVCKLGVADHLTCGPRSVQELAAQCGAHAPSLLRVLRALASRQIFAESRPGEFELTSMADLLRSDHPLSMRHAFRLAPDVEALTHLEYTIRTGEPSFDHHFGEDYFTYLAHQPDLLAEFHASQRALTRFEQVTLLRSYDWDSLGSVVDIGGGDGAFLSHLMAAHPRMRGVLFDLPGTVAQAPGILAAKGVAGRCDIVGGNFLDTVIPAGADAYMFKRVLVGLTDDQVITALRAVRDAMRPDSRLLIFEPLTSEGSVGKAMELLMLVLGRGRVRTPEEFETIFAQAGLRLHKFYAGGVFPFLEVLATAARFEPHVAAVSSLEPVASAGELGS